MMADEDLRQLLEAHKPHFTLTPEGKVKCELNGHMLPARAEAVAAFANGKKFRKLREKAEVEVDLSKYEPFLVPSRNFPRMLYCALTDDLINRNLKEVKQHIKGKKFLKAKERFQEDKQGLHTEIDLLTSDLSDEEAAGGSDAEDGEGPGLWLPETVLEEHEMMDAGVAEGEAGARQQQEEEEAPGRGDAAASSSMSEDEQPQAPRRPAAAPAAPAQNGKAKQPSAKRKQQSARSKQQQELAAEPKKPQQQQHMQDTNGSQVGKVKPPKAKRTRAE